MLGANQQAVEQAAINPESVQDMVGPVHSFVLVLRSKDACVELPVSRRDQPAITSIVSNSPVLHLMQRTVAGRQLVASSDQRRREAFNASGSKYLRKVKGATADNCVDVYAVLKTFGVTCPATQHAIKKLLCGGLRGKGNLRQDLQEARDAIDRAIQLAEVEGDGS